MCQAHEGIHLNQMHQGDVDDYLEPRWENMAESLVIDGQCQPSDEPHGEDDSNFCTYNEEKLKENSKFPDVTSFKRALNHHAVTNEFEYFIEKSDTTRFTARCKQLECKWRIHASIMQDRITFQVKSLVEPHTYVITDKLRSDGDVSVAEIRRWLVKTYNVEVPYMRVFSGKEQAYTDMYACSNGFLAGCCPYISLDACHLKGKFNGVLAAATGVDGNNSIYPVAYDMQKGLEVAITQVYPNVEHRECIRHLCSNFKKHFCGDIFSSNLWGAARTFCPIEHDKLLKEMFDVQEAAITYLNQNHKKIWSRSKFGTISKCDYITNNISEVFNSWIGDLRSQPVLDLLDAIREKFMVRFYKKRKLVEKWNGTLVPMAKSYINSISKNLGEYEVLRSSDNGAQVKFKGKQWEVLLNERTCSYRVWQVKGLPCKHAAAFIGSIRDNKWDKHVDRYFTIEKFKEAYALEISPMPAKDEWVPKPTQDKIYPPIIKRPPGQPKKKRIVPSNEPKRRQRCARCGQYGHHDKTCKNSPEEGYDPYQPSTSKRRCGKNTKTRDSGQE
ncbi:uncharacterized protein [Rutidosis leptorrhynchoides]|uniref:uncharacterized protein n=1 Tax=Rutidosis leptorrhynchoides TaxID=125765 RepID=UPI003A99FB58